MLSDRRKAYPVPGWVSLPRNPTVLAYRLFIGTAGADLESNTVHGGAGAFDPRHFTLGRPVLRGLPELRELLILADHALRIPAAQARVEELARLEHGGESFPLLAFRFGPDDPGLPVFALFGGVHGLERIGTQVVLAYLRTLLEMARWDRATQDMLATTRLVMVPLLNPVGMYLRFRANGNRVDLMRNAPVEAEGLAAWHWFGGQRLTPRLPWYRGAADAPMETEARALCDFVRREIFPARTALSIDVHSGYGKVDRLWFPYAKTRAAFPGLPEAVALKHLLDRSHPNHVYHVEPQSLHYLAHGDLWDYLYDGYRAIQPDGHYLPFTLELGSWLWVKKNWVQAFSALGVFNPRLPHRVRRTLRRHLFLFDLFHRATRSPEPWAGLEPAERGRLEAQGLRLWYGGGERERPAR
ncbi:Zinc carboxypeptidase [Methylomagnum ishizawai]|uniref:Zinc carboxypeptidase n=1 Tax=Methylomagnum ishizawai TaxID=1760988 RepID=A0A1Y6D321_9GAMM|nr:Zinc carboxypeptidase [Methylomagnum ishizawai]